MYGCQNTEAAQAYYNSIFELYAKWGVDFIKCDDICVTEFRKWDNPYSAAYEIEMIRKALDNCGRDMVLSLSPPPAQIENAAHLKAHANMWPDGDFWDSWQPLHEMFDKCELWQGIGGDTAWPDCDMLPLGRISKGSAYHGAKNRYTQFTKPEQLTMMSLWGIFRSPLMMGGNMPENDEWTLSLLTNREYIEMHQTSFGARQLRREEKNGEGSVIWIANGKKCKYIALFNTKNKAQRITLNLADVLMPNTAYTAPEYLENETQAGVKRLCPVIPPHGAALYKIY